MAAKTDWKTYIQDGTHANIGNDLTKNNKSGFAALPEGCRYPSGSFYALGTDAYWWTTSEIDSTYASSRSLFYGSAGLPIEFNNLSKPFGMAVRLVKN